jgi:hypothetical protein
MARCRYSGGKGCDSCCPGGDDRNTRGLARSHQAQLVSCDGGAELHHNTLHLMNGQPHGCAAKCNE